MPIHLYCLHEGYYYGVKERIDLLKEAAVKLNIKFTAINSLDYNYTTIPVLKDTDLLYNVSRGSELLETVFMNDSVTTFYKKNPLIISENTNTVKYSVIHEKIGLPTPKTIFQITNNKNLLKKYINYLGGFPIIIKAIGSTRGIGTIKIESWQNFISTIDYLVTTDEKFIMREFINTKVGYRVIVLGDEIIAEASFRMNKNDFRNAVLLSEIDYEKVNCSEALRKIAITATNISNLDFSGVDILEDKFGNYYLLEINFPTGFSGLIKACNVDIPYKMVKFLIDKSSYA